MADKKNIPSEEMFEEETINIPEGQEEEKNTEKSSKLVTALACGLAAGGVIAGGLITNLIRKKMDK